MKLFDIFKKKEEPAPEPPKKKKPEYEYRMIYLENQEHIEDFYKHYKKDMTVTNLYQLPASELKEDWYGEKIYKYYPLKISYEIRGNDVYSYIKEGKWMKIGTIDDESIELIQKYFTKFQIYSGDYKEVYDTIEKEEDDPFFAFLVKIRKK